MKRLSLKALVATALCASACVAYGQQQAPSVSGPYSVMDHWKVGGTGGWDYLLADSMAHRLYVTHGTQVDVLDLRTGRGLGAITGLKGTHGVVIEPDGKVGYITDGAANAVIVFDTQSLAVLTSIAAGINPDGIAYEPVTRTVWAFNGRSRNVSVIDTASRSVVATVALPGKPEFPHADGKGHVFVNIEDKNSIVELDARSHTVVSTLGLKNCESPSGMAIDREHGRLFSVCDGNQMAVVETASFKQVANASIGDGPDAAAFSEKRQLAFASSSDGTLAVVDAAHGYRTVQMLVTANGARTMAYDDATDRAYSVTATLGPAPAPTADRPHPRPSIVPGTFEVIVIGRR